MSTNNNSINTDNPQLDHSYFTLTNIGLARRFNLYYGDIIRLVGKVPYIYNGKYWKQSDETDLYPMMTSVVEMVQNEQPSLEAGKSALDKFYMRAMDIVFIKKAVSALWTIKELKVGLEIFDSNPYLFNIDNGTINLQTGMINPHNPEDLITKIAHIQYIPSASCTLWTSFLSHAFDNNGEIIRYLQEFVALSLLGETKEHVFAFLYGKTRTGKTTFLETIQTLLGGYSMTVDSSILMAKPTIGGATPEIAALQGSRFVSASEIDAGHKLHESIFKRLTGGDTISARHLYAGPVEFKSQATIWMAANDRPIIAANSDAVWRRVRVIEWNNSVADRDIDTELPHKLQTELSGILNWILEGLSRLRENNWKLNTPSIVDKATAAYRDDMDLYLQFINDVCVIDTDTKTSLKELHGAYRDWYKETQSRGVGAGKNTFSKELQRLGFEKWRGEHLTYFCGIAIRPGYTVAKEMPLVKN